MYKSRWILWGFLSIFITSLITSSQAGDPKPFIEAISPVGQVTIIRNKNSLGSVKIGAVLEVGDEIITDANGAVDIRYPDESLVRLGFNTKFIIRKLERKGNVWIAIHDFIEGNVRALVHKLEGDNSDLVHFQIHTHTGTIGVRGTEFVAQYDAVTQKTSLYTLEGKVLLGAAGIDFSNPKLYVEVNAGNTSSIDKKQKPTSPKPFDRDQYIQSAQAKGSPFAGLAKRQHGMSIVIQNAGLSPVHQATNIGSASVAPKQKPEQNKQNENLDQKLLNLVSSASKESIGVSNQDRITRDEQTAKTVLTYLAQGADPNARSSDQSTALMIASIGGLSLTNQALLEHKADINVTNDDGDSALLLATRTCQTETISALLTNNANKAQKNKHGESACTIAHKNNCSQESQTLVCQ